jgi:CsoR family transcriptional regulator, copper-sensing transcriptional repressor
MTNKVNPSQQSQSSLNHSELSPHIHNEESLKRIMNRLSRIEGHVRGIKTMVQENRPCPEVLNQIAAVKGAISSVAKIILEEHLEECLVRAVNQGNLAAEIRELKEALNLFTS